jgi:Holliday junction resolvase RusA-like endonuclease
MDKNKKLCSGGYLALEDSLVFGTLMKISTSKNKKKTREEVKRAITDDKYVQGFEKYDNLRDKLLDIAIVIYISKTNYKKQDVDNIAKVVLDSLKRELFNDDSQVIRLLVYKKEIARQEDAETFQIAISVRKHDISKDMILENIGPYNEEEARERGILND